MEHTGRTVKAEVTTVQATVPPLVAPSGQRTKLAPVCREVNKKQKATMLSGQRAVAALCRPEACTQRGPSAPIEIAQHKGKECVTNAWNRNSTLRKRCRGVVSNLCANKGSQEHAKAGIVTASADSLADEKSAGKGRSMPGQQHVGGGSIQLTWLAALGLHGEPARTLLGDTQLVQSPHCGAAAGEQVAVASICAMCSAAS
jgi:hypothetical protein